MKKVQVLLINPRSINVLPSYPPYGLLYVAAYLRENGISVEIYDSNTEERDFKRVLKSLKPKIVGISILSGPCLSDAVFKAKTIRETLPKSKIVFGGIHTTIFPSDVLENDYVDYIVANEGEHPMLELCYFILNKKGSLKNIKNLGYKKGKKKIVNPIREFIDLDTLPMPAWDLIPVEKYIHNKFYSKRVMILHTSRGCPWDCAYCYNRMVNFRKWRSISAEKVVEQISFLMEKYNIKGFQFYDDEFDVSPKRVIDFCNLLIEKNIKIKWSHYSRTNVANKERYALEKKAGCEFIEFGLESGSLRILKMLNKQQTVSNIKKAFKICHEVGLKSGAMFMIGLPTETKKEMEKTIKLVESVSPTQTINTIFHPYPGSRLYTYCVEKGLFKLPEKLEDQGSYFDIGNADINVSKAKASYLQQVHDAYAFRNVLEEVKLSFEYRNFGLIFSHIRSRFNLENFKWLFRGMLGYFRNLRK